MIDWLEDFNKRFAGYPEVRDIKRNRFHGAVEINFCGGIPENYNLKMHRRAFNFKEQPITKGGQDV